MKKVALLSDKERGELFQATALKKGIRPEAIEKDFWVCYLIDHLFHDCEYKDGSMNLVSTIKEDDDEMRIVNKDVAYSLIKE